MIFRFKKRARDPRWYENWTRWFAWVPVRLDDEQMVWLETVERRDCGTRYEEIVRWEYRRIVGSEKST